MSVIIVGGGIGGLTLALALAQRGRASTVIEQAGAFHAIGAGLQLSPNATRVLFALGLEGRLRRSAIAPVRAVVHDAASGRQLVANRLGDWAEVRWGAPYLVLTRSALQALLAEAVDAEPGIQLVMGRRVTHVHDGPTSAGLTLDDGALVHGEVVVGCDGLRSRVRGALFTPKPPRFTGQTAWRGLARWPEETEPCVQVWTGPDKHFVRYPVGGGLMNMVAVTAAAQDCDESWTHQGQGAELAAAFATWPDSVRATISAVDQPWRSAIYDRAPLRSWSGFRTTLLGDAAHPMAPFLAQGAAMAIEDAWVAAERLSRQDATSALKAFEGARLARTRKAQAWASRNALLFHLPSALAGGMFGAAKALDRARGQDPEARCDWLYGWRP